MATILTIEEFELFLSRSRKKLAELIVEANKSIAYGMAVDKDKDTLWLCVIALESWQQGNFSNREYTNFINSRQVQQIYALINTL